MSYKPEFMAYQTCRTFIPEYRSGNTFEQQMKDLISNGMAKITDNQGVGIRREHRAFGGMVKKYPSRWVIISTKIQDQLGIDIYTKLKRPNFNTDDDKEVYKIKYFAVSGPADKEEKDHCDYKVVVTERKIGLQKQKHKSS